MAEIVLKVNGLAYHGWQEVRVEKSMDQIAGSFTVRASDRYPKKPSDWKMHLGDSCSVEIADVPVIQGYIEAMPVSYSAREHHIEVNGRDVTGDLVDCSFISGGDSEFLDLSIQEIASRLCAPFGIDVVVDSSASEAVQKKTSLGVSQGDTVFEMIAKLCRIAQVLPVSYGDGKLYLTRAGSQQASGTVELGVNVLSGTLSQNDKDRFSEYIVKGQGKGEDSVADLGSIVQPKGRALDSVISRYRPLVILAEKDVDFKTARDRAEWEAHMRAGASRQYEYQVQGWLQPDGVPWEINRMVRVKDDFLGLQDGTLLISRVEFGLSSGGTTTGLTLSYPEKYDVPPPTEEDTASGISSGFDISSLID